MSEGFIYVMTRPDGGDVKVGISMDPDRRLTQVRIGTDDNLIISAAWAHQHPRKVERAAHFLLKEFCSGGEWFAVERYVAFEAVCKAIRETDCALSIAPEPPELPLRKIDIDLTGEYDLPAAPAPTGGWMLGYARPIDAVPAAPQVQWMWRCGIDHTQIYIEQVIGGYPDQDLMLKDCREGDTVYAWSPAVFSDASVVGVIAAKGARVVYAEAL